MNITQKMKALNDILVEATFLKIKIQEECPHETGIYAYKSDTGNWCESDDTYWRENKCSDCEKSWTEYHTHPSGLRNSNYHKSLGSNWKEVK